MSRAEYPDSPRYDENGEVESSTDENEYDGPRPLARWEGKDKDGYQNVHVETLQMDTRLDMAVNIIRSMIRTYGLQKGIELYRKEDVPDRLMRMKGYYHLLFALMQLEHEMDPDFAWYEKRISFENGYGASIICKPVSYGGDAKMFEIAVLKSGEVCYDTPVSDELEGFLDFEDVIEVLHEIRELPPAEKVEPKQDYVHLSEREERRDERYKKYETERAKIVHDQVAKEKKKNKKKKKQNKSSQGPEQEGANSYEVPTGPTDSFL